MRRSLKSKYNTSEIRDVMGRAQNAIDLYKKSKISSSQLVVTLMEAVVSLNHKLVRSWEEPCPGCGAEGESFCSTNCPALDPYDWR